MLRQETTWDMQALMGGY